MYLSRSLCLLLLAALQARPRAVGHRGGTFGSGVCGSGGLGFAAKGLELLDLAFAGYRRQYAVFSPSFAAGGAAAATATATAAATAAWSC